MEDIKLILAEDHQIVRNGIKLFLESQSNISVVADVNNEKEVLDLLDKGIQVDIIIADLCIEQVDGLLLIKEVTAKYPNVKFIVLTVIGCEQHVVKAFECGVKGYLIKTIGAEEMVFCIHHIANGGRYLCEDLAMQFVEREIFKSRFQVTQVDPNDLDITARELEILNLISDGFTNVEISDKLFLSKRTIEGYRQNLLGKTKSKNTPSLIKYAYKNGLIS